MLYTLRHWCGQHDIALEGLTVAVQGLGNVGGHFARLAYQAGCQVTVVGDHHGTLYNPGGLPVPDLLAWINTHGSIKGFECDDSETRWVETEALFNTPVDIMVPAALENQITLPRAQQMQCRLVIEAANGPTTAEAEAYLLQRGVEIIPDILANSGGVIVSYFEWLQNKSAHYWGADDIQSRLRNLIWEACDEVANSRERLGCTSREAAYAVALDRLRQVYDRRGIFP